MSKKCLQIVLFAALSTPFMGGNLMAMDADQQGMCINRCNETLGHCTANCAGDRKEEHLACIYACDDVFEACRANCKRQVIPVPMLAKIPQSKPTGYLAIIFSS